MNTTDFFWNALFSWYETYKRDFPWRKTDNAFHIFIAELLLQKTHARKVEEVYNQIVNKYPTPYSLAKADIVTLADILKPLGLYYRTERLSKNAKIICHEFNGLVPNCLEELKKMPGIGQYIADAILCYAYNFPTVPIDTNVIRLFTRFFSLQSLNSRPRCDVKFVAKIKSYFSFGQTKTPNLAVLDFASMVCTARKPNCESCILAEKCKSKYS